MKLYPLKSALALLFFGVAAVSLICLTTNLCCKEMKRFDQIKTVDDAISIFPTTPQAAQELIDRGLAQAKKDVEAILAIPAQERTFANTVQALDTAMLWSEFGLCNEALSTSGVFEVLQLMHPDEEMRIISQKGREQAENFLVEYITDNCAMYHAFKEYAQGNANNENLTAEQRYFLQNMIDMFERNGMHLPEEKRVQAKQLKAEIQKLRLQFEVNTAQDKSFIAATKEQLAGVPEDVVNNLKKLEDGSIRVGVDYPTYFAVMQNCTVSDTRKRLLEAFSNRAYPVNHDILVQILAKRDELGRLLGCESYAHFDLGDQMVGTPERAKEFLDNLAGRARAKEQKELEILFGDLPDSVQLTKDGKINSWDSGFARTQYRKKHFNLDETKIAEYFPMEKSIQGLFDIYQELLSLDLCVVPVFGAWHEDVRCVVVKKAGSDAVIGYIFIDLHPRANKYSHAAHAGIVPAYTAADGTQTPAVSVLVANFPKSMAGKPALFKRSDVKTFFHEFGHALHSVLGRTKLASFSGTTVKTDFVEMPSQMLENWMMEKDVLQKISSHYKTGESLAQETIDMIIKAKNFSSGAWTHGQVYNSLLALMYHLSGDNKDPYVIAKELRDKMFPHVNSIENDHFYASFGHLVGYNAKYYGYLWSRVFARDLFEEIKNHGLFDAAIGQKYIDTVIGRGGSKDPNDLLKDFLGREPNQEAFMRDMGLV